MASIGTWPASLKPETFRMVLETNQIVNSSPYGGNEQAVDRLNDRWMVSLTLPIRTHADSRALEAFLGSFRGQVNWISLWHLGQWSGQPRGTMRGSPTVSGAHSQGASALVVQTSAAATVYAGDLVGAGGLLLMASEDATANGAGVITIPLVNRLRTALTNGAAVTWDKPTAAFRKLSDSGVNYTAGISDAVTIELRERIA